MAVRGLSVALGDTDVLTGATLSARRGAITSLIGPSGSGKSTLLRCLNRLVEPPAGTVMLDGVDITTIDVSLLRRRVGLMFQQAVMFPGTVADNIAVGPSYVGAEVSPERITELLRLVGLPEDLRTRSARDLSGGQAQRVALARILANEPEVLLLDEPTSALDPRATRHVEDAVLHLNRQLGISVVWVSHSVDQVARTAHDVGLLAAGRVVGFGPAEHLLSGEHAHLSGEFAAGRFDEGAPVSHHRPEETG